jgi:CysZ protein
VFHAIGAFTQGLAFHKKGIGFAFKNPSFLGLAILPFFATLFLYGIGFYLFSSHAESLLNRLWHPDLGQTSSWLGWLYWAYVHIVKFFLYGFLLVVMFYTFIIISNILACPFYDRIAVKYERLRCGLDLKPASGWQEQGIFTVIKEELKKAAFALAVPFALLFIPVVGAFLGFLAAAILITWDYVDYSLSKACPHFKNRLQTVWHHKFSFLGYGVPLVIPFLGLLILPFAILGATMLYHDTMKESVRQCP